MPDSPADTQTGPVVDLLIIGGGINGAGIARDAAGRGLSVVLLEQADLTCATSSASTKLIHGGLRYLEFFEFRLVREALIERERLLGIAPHLIQPMEFILPHVRGLRPRWQIRAGLFIYDHLGGRKRLPATRSVRLGGARYGALRAGLDHGFAYSDCWVDDARLVVANALDAAEHGASILTHAQFIDARAEQGLWQVRYRNRQGELQEIRTRALVNAAGPWVEDVLRGIPQARVDAHTRLIKGSHIIVPRLFEGDHAFMLQNPDRRIVFTIPYQQRFTLIGTTDVPEPGDPAAVHISPEEVQYLCSAVNAFFNHRIGPADVVHSYAGVRALLDDRAENASKVTRDYRLELSRSTQHPPLLSIFGGKITTYRRLAEAVLDKIQPLLQPDARQRRGSWTHTRPLPGGDVPDADFAVFLQSVQRRWPYLDASQAARMAHAYGTRVERILGRSQSMLDLGEHYGGGFTEAELMYLRRHEWASSADDVLWRRSKLGLHLDAQARERVRQVMAQPLPESAR